MPRLERRLWSASAGLETCSRESDGVWWCPSRAIRRPPWKGFLTRFAFAPRGNEMAQEEPKDMPTIVPMVAYEDPVTAIDWLNRAFGFQERKRERIKDRDGRTIHAEVRLGNGRVFVATPTPDYQSPKHHRQTCAAARKWSAVPWVVDGLLVHVDDVDRHFARAKSAGATMLSDLENNPSGGYTGPKTSKGIGGCSSSRMRDCIDRGGED